MTPGINKISYILNFRVLKFSEIVLSLILFCSPLYTFGEKNLQRPEEDLHLTQDNLNLSQLDLHRSQDDLHRLPQHGDLHDLPQNDQPPQKDFSRKDFHFRGEDKNYDRHLTKIGPREPYNYLSSNFVNRNHGPASRISPSNQDRENEFEFPDKIVKDGQVFYRHGANQIDNHHVEDGLLDKEQSDGNFNIFKEMSHENPASGNDNLSKGFDLLLNHVKKAKENTPSISAAIAGAAIRGSSKGSFSHVIGSATNGGYFAASAKGYDDKGGSIHSHIQGTGNGAGGGASAIAPGRDGEAFIQVDNSDNGLSIGQSSTYNGEAFVIADVDKNSQYHYEKGDNTSSFNDNYKNDSHGFSFGEAKSNLYPSDASNSNVDPFKYKNIPKHHSDSNNNNQRKPLGMGLIDDIMEKVHQPGTNGNNKGTLQTESPISENYPPKNFESSPIISNEQTHSHPKDKGVVGLVTFPFNTIGSPPGPGELLTQAPVTKIARPNYNEENFEGYSGELPYYDANNNEHNNNDYFTDKDLKTKENELNTENFENFGQNQNWQHTFETRKFQNEISLSNGQDKTSTEQFHNEQNLVYQPYSSVLIDSYNNRHLLPPAYTPVHQNGVTTNSYDEFPANRFNGNDFNGISNSLPIPEHQESESWKTATNHFVSKDTPDYKIRNSQEPILQKPQVPIEAPLENDFHSMNPVIPSESWKDSNYPSISKDTKDYNYPLVGEDVKNYNYPSVSKGQKEYNYLSVNKHAKDYDYPTVSKDAKEYHYPPVSKDTNNNNYPFVNKDTNYYNYPFAGKNANDNDYDYPLSNNGGPDYKMRNLPGPILQNPQVSTEVPLETNLHSTNLVTPIHLSSNFPLSNRNHEIDTNKYFDQQPPSIENKINIDHEIPKTNYHLHNQNEMSNYDPGSSFSYQGTQAPKTNYHLHDYYSLHNQNEKGHYDPGSTFSYQGPQSPKTNNPLHNQNGKGNFDIESSFSNQGPQTPKTNYPLHDKDETDNFDSGSLFSYLGPQASKTNYPLNNQHEKGNYDPGSSFSFKDPQTPKSNSHLHNGNEKGSYDLGSSISYQGSQSPKTNYPLHNQNGKGNYDPGSSFSNQGSQASKTNYPLHNQDEKFSYDPGSSFSYQGPQASKTNYPLNNQNEKGTYDPGLSFSYQGSQTPMPFEDNLDPNTPHVHSNYPLYNQNLSKDSYGQIIPISNQDQQLLTISNMNEIVSQGPSANNNPGVSGTMVTTTERMQVITPGAAGQIQHLNASEPGFPNIRVLTINNNDERIHFYQREGTSIGPGEKIPGAPGYKVPPGFRGRVVLGHQLPVNVESKKAVPGYNTRINLTPQRPYAGPVFASVSGPQAASKMNPNFGNGVQITLSSPNTKLSNLSRRPQGTSSGSSRNENFNRKLSTPTSSYTKGNGNINDSKQGSPEIIKNSNGQCGYYINECVRPPPFYRNYCSHRFIIVGCHY